MSEYLKSLEPNDTRVTLKSFLKSVSLINIPWLLKSEKKILTNFQILPGVMSQSILSKRQVCTQRNQ